MLRQPNPPRYPLRPTCHSVSHLLPPRNAPRVLTLCRKTRQPSYRASALWRPPLLGAPSSHFSWLKLWGALLVESLLIPPLMLYTAWSPAVLWAGVRYRKWDGRVVAVERLPPNPAAIHEVSKRCRHLL